MESDRQAAGFGSIHESMRNPARAKHGVSRTQCQALVSDLEQEFSPANQCPTRLAFPLCFGASPGAICVVGFSGRRLVALFRLSDRAPFILPSFE